MGCLKRCLKKNETVITNYTVLTGLILGGTPIPGQPVAKTGQVLFQISVFWILNIGDVSDIKMIRKDTTL